jgi:hypothetical protein
LSATKMANGKSLHIVAKRARAMADKFVREHSRRRTEVGNRLTNNIVAEALRSLVLLLRAIVEAFPVAPQLLYRTTTE